MALVDYLVDAQEAYVEGQESEHWVFRFDVPDEAWASTLMPARGAATPAAIIALVDPAAGGTVLGRHVDFKERPGYVVVRLTCGWSGWNYFDPLTRVSCRQVTVREKLAWSIDGTPKALSGPVMTTAETRAKQRYALLGDDQTHDETYVQINITSIVASIPAGWQGSNFNKRNQAAVTIRGMTYPTGTVLYTGGGSEDVPASQSPTGAAAYRMNIVLLAGPKAWPLTVDRYVETKTVIRLPVADVSDPATTIGYSNSVQWVRAAAATDSPKIREEFDMVTALAALP
jgi:hypothetical protein